MSYPTLLALRSLQRKTNEHKLDNNKSLTVPIPVTRVSNGQGGPISPQVLTKDSRPPPLSHHCTTELSSLAILIPVVIAMIVPEARTNILGLRVQNQFRSFSGASLNEIQ